MGWAALRVLTTLLGALADTVLLVTPWATWGLLQITWCVLQVARLLLGLITMLPTWVTLLAFLVVLCHIPSSLGAEHIGSVLKGLVDWHFADVPPSPQRTRSGNKHPSIRYSMRSFTTFQRLNIPGPRPLPLLGNLLPVILKGVLRTDKDHIFTYGKVVGTYEGHTPTLIVADPRLLKQIMIKQFHNFQDRRGGGMHKFPMRRALTSLRGSHWRHVRGLLTPTFSAAKLKNMVPLISDCCQTLVKNLKKTEGESAQVDLKTSCGAFTMDVIASTAFGIQIDSQNDPNSPFVRHAKRVFNFHMKPAVMLVVLLLGSISTWIIRKLKINFFPKDVTDFFVGVIDDVMNHRKDNSKTQTDFLKLMMNAQVDEPDPGSIGQGQQEVVHGPDGLWTKQGLTYEEILAQSLLFFLAGYETTATTLSFAGYCLATHPHYQNRLMEEIDSLCQDEKSVGIETVGMMSYLEMVVCETLRMYPPAGRITRICCRGTVLNGVTIETGTVIVIPIYSIHHDPELWPEPHIFNPERFAPEHKFSREAGTWIPFGMGPRQCIGVRLAMLEIKMALIFLLRHFHFETCSKTEIPLKMKKRGLLQPERPIHITLRARDISQDSDQNNSFNTPSETCPETYQNNYSSKPNEPDPDLAQDDIGSMLRETTPDSDKSKLFSTLTEIGPDCHQNDCFDIAPDHHQNGNPSELRETGPNTHKNNFDEDNCSTPSEMDSEHLQNDESGMPCEEGSDTHQNDSFKMGQNPHQDNYCCAPNETAQYLHQNYGCSASREMCPANEQSQFCGSPPKNGPNPNQKDYFSAQSEIRSDTHLTYSFEIVSEPYQRDHHIKPNVTGSNSHQNDCSMSSETDSGNHNDYFCSTLSQTRPDPHRNEFRSTPSEIVSDTNQNDQFIPDKEWSPNTHLYDTCSVPRETGPANNQTDCLEMGTDAHPNDICSVPNEMRQGPQQNGQCNMLGDTGTDHQHNDSFSMPGGTEQHMEQSNCSEVGLDYFDASPHPQQTDIFEMGRDLHQIDCCDVPSQSGLDPHQSDSCRLPSDIISNTCQTNFAFQTGQDEDSYSVPSESSTGHYQKDCCGTTKHASNSQREMTCYDYSALDVCIGPREMFPDTDKNDSSRMSHEKDLGAQDDCFSVINESVLWDDES